MPELPEVETIRRDLAACLVGRSFQTIRIISAPTVKNSAAFFKSRLVGRKITAIRRRGKLLIFKVGSAKEFWYLLIHLKMTGQLIYQNK
jgi:formamidopyrimidine-DNA glycosylase